MPERGLTDKLLLLYLISSLFPDARQVPNPVLCQNSAVEEMNSPWLLSLCGRKAFCRFRSRETSQALLCLHLVPAPSFPSGTCTSWGLFGSCGGVTHRLAAIPVSEPESVTS